MAYSRHHRAPWAASTDFNGPRYPDIDNVGPYPTTHWVRSLDEPTMRFSGPDSPRILDAVTRAQRRDSHAPTLIQYPQGPDGQRGIIFEPQPAGLTLQDLGDAASGMKQERQRSRNDAPRPVDMVHQLAYNKSVEDFCAGRGERHRPPHLKFTTFMTRMMDDTPETLPPTSNSYDSLESSPIHSPRGEALFLEETHDRRAHRRQSHRHRSHRPNLQQADHQDPRRSFPINLYGTPTAILLTAELPGVQKDSLTIYYNPSDATLEISAPVLGPASFEEEAELCVQEIDNEDFYRKVVIPEKAWEKWEVDADGVTADLKDGVLTVALPRAERESTKVRRVAIE